ncbi:hypothetical protein HK405_004133, partial [Cladochytrium tenue]
MATTIAKLASGASSLVAAVTVLAPIALPPSPLLNATHRRPRIRTPTHLAPTRASAAYAASYSSSAGGTAADDDAQLYLVLANPRAVNTLNAAMKLKRRALTAEEADAAATLLGLPASSVYAYVRRHAASKLPMQRVQAAGGHVPQRARVSAADATETAAVQPLPKYKASPLSLLRRAIFTEDEDLRILAYAAQKRVAAAVAAGIPRTLPATSTDPAAPAAAVPNPAFLDAICPVSPSTGGQRAVSLHDLELELNGARRRRRASAASNTAATPRQAPPLGAGEPLPLPQETRPVSRDELNARLIDLECGLAPGSRLKTWKLTPDELARVRRGIAATRLAHAARAATGAGPAASPAASPALAGILRSFEPLAAAPQPHDPTALPGLEAAGPLFLRAWIPAAVNEAQCRAVGSIVGERPDAAVSASPPPPPPPQANEAPALAPVAATAAGATVVTDPASGAGPAEPTAPAVTAEAADVEPYSDDPYDTDLSSYLILYGPLPKVGLSFSRHPPTRFEDALRNGWSTTDPPDYEGFERGRAFWIAVLNATGAADAATAATAAAATSPALPASGRPLLGRTWQQCRQGWTERLWSREEDAALRWLVGVACGLVHPGDVPMTRRAVDRVFAEFANHPALRPRPDGRDALSDRSPLWQDVARYGRVRGRPLKNMAFRWQFLVRTGEVFGRSGEPAAAAAASVAEATADSSPPSAAEGAEPSTKSDSGAPA